MSCRVPTLDAPPLRLPPINRRNARRRFAPPGANGTRMVSSETLPRRTPVRPALSRACGGGCVACAVSSWSTLSSAFRPSSGASANSARSCWIFSLPARARSDSVGVNACVAITLCPFVNVGSFQVCEPLQGTHARHEKVLAALQHVEGLDAMNASPDRCLRNREGRPFLLPPDDRVALVAHADEIAVVDPLLLQKFDRGHRLGADEFEDGAA